MDSVAAIKIEAGTNWFNNNMFIFRTAYYDTNSIENPDTLGTDKFSKDKIKDTFDGRIVYTNGNGKQDTNFRPDVVRYSTQTDLLKRFYTSNAVTETYDIKELNNVKNKVKYDSNNKVISGYWSEAEYDVYNFDKFITHMAGRTANTPDNVKGNNLHLKDTSLFDNENNLRIRYKNDQNFDLYIDSSLGNSDDPLYIYIEPGFGHISINLNYNMGRPLIICMGGNDNQRSQVIFNLNGYTYKGVLYTPYCNQGEGILTKSNGKKSKFIGTMVGETLNLQNNDMHFEYHDYIGSNGNQSVGGSLAGGGPVIHLVDHRLI